MDREVGLLRQALEEAGLWEKTVLIVSADHGEQLYEHGYISHSAQVYEESMQVPLVVRFPAGKGPHGLRIKELADLLGPFFTPLRVAVTGKTVSPPLFGSFVALGRERTIERLRHAQKLLSAE